VGAASALPSPAQPVGGLVHVATADEGSRASARAELRGLNPAALPGNPREPSRTGDARGEAARGRRRAKTPIEFWAEDAVVQLARATGVSAFDAPLLRALVAEVERGLDDGRWLALVKVCRRYAAVVGSPPT
jgi:hypothetical protein